MIQLALWTVATIALGLAALLIDGPAEPPAVGTGQPAGEVEITQPDTPASSPETTTSIPAGTVVRVVGNQLVGSDGLPMRLTGVNRAGGEYACIQGLGVWDGAADAALVGAMSSWGVNSVRLPLNEQCWLGTDADNPLAGAVYRQAVVDFVQLLVDAELVAVLDLHWSGPGDVADTNMSMPNANHSEDFWRSVAAEFVDEEWVIFDIFNEPHDVDWECWRDGCEMPEGFTAVGMQDLVDAVRSTGAMQPIVVSGINYANDLSRWLEMAPVDPANSLIAGLHVYNFNKCNNVSCWDSTVVPVAEEYPVVAAEVGEDSCSGEFIAGFLDWADSRGISYLGWTFNPWDCEKGPALIVDDAGTPTPFGEVFRDHLLGADDG